MWREFFITTQTRARAQARNFGLDTGQVLQALGSWGVVFLLCELVLGLLPVLMVLTLGATIDAMIGARGIGVVTSDVNNELVRWLVMLVAGFLAYLFLVRFTGKAGEVGRGLRDIVIFGSLLIYLLAVQQFFLSLICLLIITVDSIFAYDVRVRMAGLLLAILAGSSFAHTLIKHTVLRSFTVGEGLSMIAAIAVFIVFLKLRIATAKD